MQRGFSLVELAVVLTIIGLIAGGIMAARTMIRSSEVNSVVSQYQRYSAASEAFRDKYNGVPGDIPNATSIWGDNNTSCPDANVNGSPGTCNGDDDGYWATAAAAADATSENFQAWNQLALAGFIDGSYTGTYSSTGTVTYGTQYPLSKLRNAGWSSASLQLYAGDASFYALDYGNYLYLRNTGTVTGAVLTPKEAWTIDSKIDDGLPAYGKVIGAFWNNTCATPDDGATFTNSNLTSSYRLSDDTEQCALIFRNIL
jgi:prepilin-type N-terminal cleavage/methylation domain-containing protein